MGIGSDFDGILEVPSGLEDASKYPYLVGNLTLLMRCLIAETRSFQMAELIRRGWTDEHIIALAGGNLT